ncbi:hypothetical protein V8C26DRAFT_385500 [Trichoderma gracile]
MLRAPTTRASLAVLVSLLRWSSLETTVMVTWPKEESRPFGEDSHKLPTAPAPAGMPLNCCQPGPHLDAPRSTDILVFESQARSSTRMRRRQNFISAAPIVSPVVLLVLASGRGRQATDTHKLAGLCSLCSPDKEMDHRGYSGLAEQTPSLTVTNGHELL